jgi:ubiquinone biosynthesis protein UbiJ
MITARQFLQLVRAVDRLREEVAKLTHRVEKLENDK